jgi:tetratricopeptide (TPR) repeat protein
MRDRSRRPKPGPDEHFRILRLPTLLVLLFLLPLLLGCPGKDRPTGGDAPPAEAPPVEMSDSRALLDYAKTRGIGVDERIQALEQLVSDYPESPEAEEALGFLADTLANQMRVEEAAARYRELVERYPGGGGNHRAHRYLVGYARRVLEDEEQARAFLRAAVKDLSLALDEDPGRLLGPTAIELANAQLELEDWEGALATYGRMVEAPSGDDVEREVYRITAEFHIGNVLARLGRTGEARASYERTRGMIDATGDLDAVRRGEMEARVREAFEALDAK